MTKRRLIIGAVIVGIPVLALGWWLGSPLLFDTEVSEEFPMSAGAVIPDDMTPEEVEAAMVDAAGEPGAAVDEDMPASPPIALVSGQFEDFDSFHNGSGTATVYDLEDGSLVLRLEGFGVTNGPDLHVLLVPDGDPGGRDDVTGYVDLGELKGNIGDQNYNIPAGIDIDGYGSVVIYCQPFHVIFSVASLG
ncbi:MAG: DM13 domain-containing protein [Acidimicrobiia bacterium]